MIEACRQLGLPIVRWPGGNFTSPYHWEDGTGPRDERPRRLELAWGSEESNRFGTPEFLAWCDAVGTVPYLHHGARNVDDAVRWVEYANSAGDTTYTRRRAADGHPAPYGVRYWGIGNEVWGEWQMGRRSAERYVEDAREHARFMRLVDPSLTLVAVGRETEDWLEPVVAGLGESVDLFSIHMYAVSRHLTTPTRDEFDRIVAQSLYFEQTLMDTAENISRVLAERHIDRPISIAMDEWNIRHVEPDTWPEPMPGSDGGVGPRDLDSAAAEAAGERVNRYSPRTLADALFYAGVFHAMHRTSRLDVPVTMANTVNLVNANGLLSVREDAVVRTATYHVWDLYQNHTGPHALECRVTAPSSTVSLRLGTEIRRASGELRTRPAVMSHLDVSPSLSADGSVLHVAVINRSATDDVRADLRLGGAPLPRHATMRQIGAGEADLFATNSVTRPDRVALSAPRTVEVTDGAYMFPAHSITLLDFDLEPKELP